MRFKDKAHGLNPLVVFLLQIELQQHNINWLVTEHLNVQGKQDPSERSIVFSVQTKVEPS
jgi:hypothetical protein